MLHAYLLDLLPLRVVQLVHVPVYVVKADILVKVRFQVLDCCDLALRLADARNHQMTQDLVIDCIEADAVIDVVQNDLRSVMKGSIYPR